MGAATFPLHRGDNTRAEALLVQPVRSRDEFLLRWRHAFNYPFRRRFQRAIAL